MQNNSSGSRHAIYRLTLDAAQTIKSKIDLGKLDGFLGQPPKECLLNIFVDAKEILERESESTKGCNNDRDVKQWLEKRVCKTKPVFIALCHVVRIDWQESFEPEERFQQINDEFLYKDRKSSIRDLIDSLLDRFASSEEEKEAIKFKYAPFIKELIMGDRIDPIKTTDLIMLIKKDFATDGRQIRLNIEDPSKSYRFIWVEISGLNQNRELSTWVHRYNVPFPPVIETNNWWWQESISIKFEATNGKRSIIHSGAIHITQSGFVWAYVSFWLETGKFTVDNSYPQ